MTEVCRERIFFSCSLWHHMSAWRRHPALHPLNRKTRLISKKRICCTRKTTCGHRVVRASPHAETRVAPGMPDAGGDAPPLKTRATLKRELMETIPHGSESAYLAKTEEDLLAAQHRLRDLRDEHVRIMRLISVRERKLRDWKGKVPRATDADPTLADAQVELARAGEMVCHRVASVLGGGRVLKFGAAYAKALDGLGGFAKLWVIMLVPASAASALACGECVPGVSRATREGSTSSRLFLNVVDVVTCDVAAGVVEMSGLIAANVESNFGAEALTKMLNDVVVLDVKPYLSYCEAWPESPIVR